MEQQSTNAHLIRYKEGLGKYTEHMPELAHSFNEFTRNCFKAGEVSEKQKQLIALGISIYSQDEYCIIYHTKGSLDQGATPNEVLETVGVAAAFGGGAAMSQGVTLVQECIEQFNKPMH
ncbi:hypothetical protein A374_02849 [Fictibacillus macauensis ZFHKF-1]|uniref:Carboxymuconolactone decarboxylase-like domain-containing protein n=1 Tax=Fictibacillus macauensis ZFHKF-1 TaxID=1196324 RepID=I8AMF8_9BACL|nr:carboxymuconolactone decarboxylase family protein [Fictibacillus macauensis]EIT87157.1 hypothetical protein A374_02849 [Fictibacillus macauensis ZFHKF-1]